MNDVQDRAEAAFFGWAGETSFLEIIVIGFIVCFVIYVLVKLYAPIRAFLNFMDVLQRLPGFMDQTNRRFLVLFKHLDIDPREAEKDEYGDEEER